MRLDKDVSKLLLPRWLNALLIFWFDQKTIEISIRTNWVQGCIEYPLNEIKVISIIFLGPYLTIFKSTFPNSFSPFCCVNFKINKKSYKLDLTIDQNSSFMRLYQFGKYLFSKNGPFPASFSLFSSFSIQLTVNVQYKFLLMTGFEPQISGIGSKHSTNWATTTALNLVSLSWEMIYI